MTKRIVRLENKLQRLLGWMWLKKLLEDDEKADMTFLNNYEPFWRDDDDEENINEE